LDSAKVERDIQMQTYQQTLQTAFREVADALAVRSTWIVASPRNRR
jgi:multidrug efflux system outer membrane protein